MQVEILEHVNPAGLQKDINIFIDEIIWDECAEQINEIVDIKYVTCYDHAEKEILYSAMILYKST